MGLADDSKLPGGEGDRPLAADPALDQAIPGFTLRPLDCARLEAILSGYAPYSNGQTAVFWHVVGVIGSHRAQLKQVPGPKEPARRHGARCICGDNINPRCPGLRAAAVHAAAIQEQTMSDWHIKIGIERPEGRQSGDIWDMDEARREIAKAMRDSALIRSVMQAADHAGLSGEDRYTLLAYEALVALETNWKEVMRIRMLDPMPPPVPRSP